MFVCHDVMLHFVIKKIKHFFICFPVSFDLTGLKLLGQMLNKIMVLHDCGINEKVII